MLFNPLRHRVQNYSPKSLQRFYGIVIAKPRNVMLKVMFIGIHDGINNFFTKDYIINSWGCFLMKRN